MAMSRESVLAQGRVAAEAGMVDTCTITRDTVTGTDPDTGVQTVITTTLYSGKCRLQQHSTAGARTAEAGEQDQLMQPLELQLPMSSSGFAPFDLVVIDTSVHDPDLAGRRFRVRTLAHKTHATARRLGIEEAS